jgi:hypothetical protein
MVIHVCTFELVADRPRLGCPEVPGGAQDCLELPSIRCFCFNEKTQAVSADGAY